jgi:hypothetical protein
VAVVALVRIPGWVERARNAAVVAGVVDMRADTGFAAVDTSGRTRVRVDVSSEVVDGPFRWDSGMTVVPSASELAGDALSWLLPKVAMAGQTRTAMMLDVVPVEVVVRAPSDESLVG